MTRLTSLARIGCKSALATGCIVAAVAAATPAYAATSDAAAAPAATTASAVTPMTAGWQYAGVFNSKSACESRGRAYEQMDWYVTDYDCAGPYFNWPGWHLYIYKIA